MENFMRKFYKKGERAIKGRNRRAPQDKPGGAGGL